MNDILSLREMIAEIEKKCLSWIGRDADGNCVLIDPHEKEPIGAHYAMTHCAAALIIGHSPEDEEFRLGIELTKGILSRWWDDSGLPAFHNDFNNMGLCLIEERLGKLAIEDSLCKKIREAVKNTPDSNNPTVNWLPMRIYVNLRRQAWGVDGLDAGIEKINSDVKRAMNKDGFVEDRLPKGVSFNLQYDVATAALLAFLNEEGQHYDVSKSVVALVNALGPDGDINYLGRGCNQIFAWGLWLYLLKEQGQKKAFELSFEYLVQRYKIALDKDNLLLNNFEGDDKDFWWDYHYASVYISHLLLWLTLCDGLPVKWAEDIVPSESYGLDSGVSIVRKEAFFAVSFSGRREYLSEKGPAVAELWTKKHGILIKGSFGPWLKKFGENYITSGVLLNHFGLLKLSQLFDCACSPDFAYAGLDTLCDKAVFRFRSRRGVHVLNLPLQNASAIQDLRVSCDGQMLALRELGVIKNQFGYITVFQSKPSKGTNWQVEVLL